MLVSGSSAVPGYLHEAATGAPVRGGALLLSGAGGGVLGPGHVYPPLASRLAAAGVHALRLDYRHPARLEPCLDDAHAAVEFLAARGAERVVVVGWSFGGAVALQAAERWPAVAGAATVASQTAGMGPVEDIPRSGKKLLLLHGTGDTCLSDRCSRMIHAAAMMGLGEKHASAGGRSGVTGRGAGASGSARGGAGGGAPGDSASSAAASLVQMHLYEGDNHGLTNNAANVQRRLLDFIIDALAH